MEIQLRVGYFRKGQMKIQQMAFMLVAVVIFFAMVGLIFFAVSYSGIERKAQELRDAEARETVKQLAGVPELAFTSSTDCQYCVDFDKALQLKEKIKTDKRYEDFWNLGYLAVERIYPDDFSDVDCMESNYPKCGKIILIDKGGGIAGQGAFVSLVRWEPSLGGVGGFKYELGKLVASGVSVNEN